MKNIVDVLSGQARKALKIAVGSDIEPEITPSTQPQFGHYQCNNALKLAKELKSNPRAIAQKIINDWVKDPMIQKMEIAGPGFINIFLSTEYIATEINRVFHDVRLGVPLPKVQQRIIVEFSSPNIAKELHVGHLRSTIIGDSLARLFEFLGHDVLRLNHIGDWGTQFGMLITYMRDTVPDVLEGRVPADLTSLMRWYRESKKRFDEDPDFKKRSQLQVVKLQGGDEVALAAWQMICDISKQSYHQIYKLLDVKLIDRGESFYNPYLPEVITDLEKRGMITLSDGAKCIYLEGYVNREGEPLPIIIQKSDGGFNYDTTDMAGFRHRIEIEKADRIIILTDAGQALHFEMIAKAAEKAGYLDPKKVRFDHVPFGVVLGPDGKKFKTRSGDTERLIDLLFEAVSHAKKLLKERIPELPEAELDHTAQVLGIDAVKYADLSSHRIKDYVFSYDRMLRFEGNTAAFLLYAYVRIQSIKRKVGKPLPTHAQIKLTHPTEIDLALHLRQFGEILDIFAEELLPNRLAEYLYTAAEKFHAFFRDCRVEGAPEEESRLLLCEVTGRILHQGLAILGLQTLDKM
ncbi:MAG TPA: arginine--tRNA ligase [Rhabdochlamydiaceae bacterium]|nr:arginine--tRNA ligase [Rhabdochlamydiaceae bacterium]